MCLGVIFHQLTEPLALIRSGFLGRAINSWHTPYFTPNPNRTDGSEAQRTICVRVLTINCEIYIRIIFGRKAARKQHLISTRVPIVKRNRSAHHWQTGKQRGSGAERQSGHKRLQFEATSHPYLSIVRQSRHGRGTHTKLLLIIRRTVPGARVRLDSSERAHVCFACVPELMPYEIRRTQFPGDGRRWGLGRWGQETGTYVVSMRKRMYGAISDNRTEKTMKATVAAAAEVS